MKSLESYSSGVWLDTVTKTNYSGAREGDDTTAEVDPPDFAYLREVEEVNLDGLRARDYLIIHTENSVYRFTILDPERRSGLLSGGALGFHRVKATLVATVSENQPEEEGAVMTIRQHSRVIFSFPSEHEAERLITSPIKKLTRVTSGLSTVTMPIA